MQQFREQHTDSLMELMDNFRKRKHRFWFVKEEEIRRLVGTRHAQKRRYRYLSLDLPRSMVQLINKLGRRRDGVNWDLQEFVCDFEWKQGQERYDTYDYMNTKPMINLRNTNIWCVTLALGYSAIKCDNHSLGLSHKVCVYAIIGKVHYLLKEYGNVLDMDRFRYLCLVGGLSESNYVQYHMEQEFGALNHSTTHGSSLPFVIRGRWCCSFGFGATVRRQTSA